MQFLVGVRSLVSFGATCTANRIVMKNEIERRKAVIVELFFNHASHMIDALFELFYQVSLMMMNNLFFLPCNKY